MPLEKRETVRLSEIARLLSSDANLRILSVLSSGDSYPREISLLTGIEESDVSRRLRRLERAGLVEGYWGRISGKNVRFYKLSTTDINISISNGKVNLVIGREEHSIIPLQPVSPPPHGKIVGREEELSRLANTDKPVIHVWGPPGIGKTSLVSYYVTRYLGDRPVFWHSSIPGDSPSTITLRMRAFASYLGFHSQPIPPWDTGSATRFIYEALRSTGSIMVIDDYHLLPKETKDVVVALANMNPPPPIIIVSRVKERRLPFWKNTVEEMELGPIREEYINEFIGSVVPPDKKFSSHAAREIWRLSHGIPILMYAIANIARGEDDIGLVAGEVLKSYIHGEISSKLDESLRTIVELLAVAGGWMATDTVCRALKLNPSTCEWRLMRLASMGLIENVSGKTRTRELLVDLYRHIPQDRRKALVSVLYHKLSESSKFEDKVRGLELIAKECVPDESIHLLRKRLLTGHSLFLCCIERYMRALENLSRCKPNSKVEPYLRLELALVKTASYMGDIYRAIKELDKWMPWISLDKPVYTRLLFIRAGLKLNNSMVGEGSKDFREALSLYDSLTAEEKSVIDETMAATATIFYLHKGDAEKALYYAEKEAEHAAASGDINNYLIARGHVAEILRLFGRFEKAYTVIMETMAEAEELNASEITRNALMVPLSITLIGLGRYDDAFEEAMKPLTEGKKVVYLDSIVTAAATAAYLSGRDEITRNLIEQNRAKICKEKNLHPGSDCIIFNVLQEKLEFGKPKKTWQQVIPENILPGIKSIIELIINR